MKPQKIEIDGELYKQWLENKVVELEKYDSRETIEDRIIELEKINFFNKREASLLHEKRNKLMGSSWSKASHAMSDPDFKVNFDADVREKSEPKVKKEKKPKVDLLASLGIDKSSMAAKIAELRAKKEAEKSATEVKQMVIVDNDDFD